MSRVVINVATVQALLGDDVRVESTTTGVKVNLELKRMKSDRHKCQVLETAFQTLEKAGYPVTDKDFRIATGPKGGGKGPWTSWPCIHVNRPTEEAPRSSKPTPQELIDLVKSGLPISALVAIYGNGNSSVAESSESESTEEVTTEVVSNEPTI